MHQIIKLRLNAPKRKSHDGGLLAAVWSGLLVEGPGCDWHRKASPYDGTSVKFFPLVPDGTEIPLVTGTDRTPARP